MIAAPAAQPSLRQVVDLALAGGGEEVLMAATEIGRQMVRDEVLPEDAVAAWSQALVAAAQRRRRRLDAAAVEAGCAPLVELMMGYSLAFREQLEQRRDEEQRHLRAIAEQAADGVLVCDSGGQLQWLNEAMRALLAPRAPQPPCALQGTLELRTPGAADEPAAAWSLQACLQAALRDGRPWRGELLDRHQRHLEATLVPIRDRLQRAAGAALFLRDVSHLRELEHQCRQRERLEAVGTLAAGIAHDFNNLVGALLGFADLGRASVHDAQAARGAFEQIGIVGLRARGLVQQITAFAAQQHEEVERVDLRTVVEESLGFFDAGRPRGIALQRRLPASPAWVRGHAAGLQRLLLNLLNNACHALQWRSGTIAVVLDQGPLDDAVPQGPGCWQLSVSDDGCGMSAEVQARVFDPFFTTREVGQGTGLGLSVAYGLVQALGGRIRLRSAPGLGTCFEVRLPLWGDADD